MGPGCGSLSGADRRLLARAIECGRRGWGRVHPNPMVGALVVRGDEVLGEAFHAGYGGPHAEVSALAAVGDARGTTLYCSLEPCSHQGKTPPCTEAILAAGVARVVFWAAEPGVEQKGGAEWLRSRGVVVDGPFGKPSDWAAENPVFFHNAAAGVPYVALKLAVSMDGRIAPARGRRVWLTGEASRREVHRLRAGFDAILVGTRTWEADDPMLTARGAVVPRVPPVAVLLDRCGRASTRLRALRSRSGPHSIVATAPERAGGLARRLAGCADVVAVPVRDERLDLAVLMEALAARGVRGLLCEGGGVLAASLLREELVDRLYLFVAPVIVGEGGVPAFPVGQPGERAEETLRFKGWKSVIDPSRFGNDTLVVLDRVD
ncbi:MAG: bifunctional diaminohydroxyphosphoribosylaminopyrimidine deaminase/5-amino-6-(5-phosphoribosylamino)uracil reductase RibD [Gemmatimonadetes bacterium]|nr:bifunctional diaminohydroxyphosphoribosylaminopyrimidine deaminase/5-amino-6-(5-phosphoribosylamino)uracil reductase RibD [Gemmatimonadota bacterium]